MLIYVLVCVLAICVYLTTIATNVGNLQKAFDYCNIVNQEGLFLGSLKWQQCALSVVEV